MKASDFDKAFDDGEDINHLIDWSSLRRPNLERRRLEIDVPSWVADTVDDEAQRRGITPQALLQLWISEKLS